MVNSKETTIKRLAAADLQQTLLLVRKAQENIRGNPKCSAATSLMHTLVSKLILHPANFLMTTNNN